MVKRIRLCVQYTLAAPSRKRLPFIPESPDVKQSHGYHFILCCNTCPPDSKQDKGPNRVTLQNKVEKPESPGPRKSFQRREQSQKCCPRRWSLASWSSRCTLRCISTCFMNRSYGVLQIRQSSSTQENKMALGEAQIFLGIPENEVPLKAIIILTQIIFRTARLRALTWNINGLAANPPGKLNLTRFRSRYLFYPTK